ncbi:hypothetical protein Taro_053682 [Colocasia esculenta]|uniref:Uncharacterized protein n=1 Tax=Colocasia esculenta TaxID=4460 RepID=A0A843XLM3_COLES|nr:hypothetical protein [Colocasia esculenta]
MGVVGSTPWFLMGRPSNPQFWFWEMGSTSHFNCSRPQKRTWSGGVDPMVPHGSTLQSSVLVLGNGVDLTFQLRSTSEENMVWWARLHGSSWVDPPFLNFASGKWGRPHVSIEVDLRRKHGHGKGIDRMTQLMNPTPLEESDDTTHLPILTPEEAFRQVFGRDRPGRIRYAVVEDRL